MPASTWGRPEDLVENLSSLDTSERLKALRDVKNQIIGNRTKKLSYIKLGAVPRVVEILTTDTETPLLVQSAAAVGSFACGSEAGVKAVLDSGVIPHLLKMLSFGDNKVGFTLRCEKNIFRRFCFTYADLHQITACRKDHVKCTFFKYSLIFSKCCLLEKTRLVLFMSC